MVTFPAAFIFPAYEGDSALNHMLTRYKVISVIFNLNLRCNNHNGTLTVLLILSN